MEINILPYNGDIRGSLRQLACPQMGAKPAHNITTFSIRTCAHTSNMNNKVDESFKLTAHTLG